MKMEEQKPCKWWIDAVNELFGYKATSIDAREVITINCIQKRRILDEIRKVNTYTS